MQRIFIKDVGRYKKGEVRDYTKQTWEGIARSLKQGLDAFSKVAVMTEQQEPKTQKEQANVAASNRN